MNAQNIQIVDTLSAGIAGLLSTESEETRRAALCELMQTEVEARRLGLAFVAEQARLDRRRIVLAARGASAVDYMASMVSSRDKRGDHTPFEAE